MRFITPFILLFFNFGFSQESIEIDDDFTLKSLKSELVYYLDLSKLATKESIQDKEFSSFDKNFPGANDSRVWLRLKFKNVTTKNKELVYRINTTTFNNLSLYKNTNGSLKEVYSFEEKQKKHIQFPFVLNKGEIAEYYFVVDFTKSIFFPIKVFSEDGLTDFYYKRWMQLGLYYGFSIVVLLINLMFYFINRNRFFLLYCGLLISITLSIFELDGLFYDFFGNSKWIEHLNLLFYWLILVFVVLFSTEALQLNKYYPKLIYYGVSSIVLSGIVYLLFIASDNLLWYIVGEVINSLCFTIYTLSAVSLFKKSLYARFALVAYLVLYISNILYILPSQFGVFDIGFSVANLKTGSIIEMMVFLYAISFRHKKVTLEKDKVQTDLNEKIRIENESHSKSSEETLESFTKHYKLSLREKEVMTLILKGNSNKHIAEKLFIQESTVKYHISNIFKKLNIKKRIELGIMFNDFKK
ncbi:LuxR C-terminal-related transcriptional regulator [Wenyingzhuangia sp. 1_MG-2023]|nr:LuxR C-terminal-related transcriptional regulator [Wenyingzhuangia sp. 1_MG-2023]